MILGRPMGFFEVFRTWIRILPRRVTPESFPTSHSLFRYPQCSFDPVTDRQTHKYLFRKTLLSVEGTVEVWSVKQEGITLICLSTSSASKCKREWIQCLSLITSRVVDNAVNVVGLDADGCRCK